MPATAVTIGFVLFLAVLFVNAMIADRMANEVNDAHAGPYISPFEKGWRRTGFFGRARSYSLVLERHKELFPQSRLRTVQKVVQYGAMAGWFGFVAFSAWTDHQRAQAPESMDAAPVISR